MWFLQCLRLMQACSEVKTNVFIEKHRSLLGMATNYYVFFLAEKNMVSPFI